VRPQKPSRDEELRAAFARSQKAIHFAFVSVYRLSEEEAADCAATLSDWFVRLNHRPGLLTRPTALIADTFLITANACQLAREFQVWKLDGTPCPDEELRKVLSRDPKDVAIDLLNRLLGENP
jgi:hypothetical protein